MLTVEQINEFSENGIPMGDNCEVCETTEKPIYHVQHKKYEVDIILCPHCIGEFQRDVASIKYTVVSK